MCFNCCFKMLKHVASGEENGTILGSCILCNLAFRYHCMRFLKQGTFKETNCDLKMGDWNLIFGKFVFT